MFKINKNTIKLNVLIFLLILSLGSFIVSCEQSFTPFPVVDGVRIIGVKADYPEICPLGEGMCPENTYKDTVKLALLAVDETGIVADGLHPNGPYIKDGYSINWAICTYSFRGTAVESPDCTLNKDKIVGSDKSFFELKTSDMLNVLMETLKEIQGLDTSNIDNNPAMVPNEDMEIPQQIGIDIYDEKQREWGIKSITLSNRIEEDININPRLNAVYINGQKVENKDEPFVTIKTGKSYKIAWDLPVEEWQRYKQKTMDGIQINRELYGLTFWSTGGSFSNDGTIPLFLENDEMNELYFRAPVDVPEEGLELTVIFKLIDMRGGMDWVYGKVKVERGKSIFPE